MPTKYDRYYQLMLQNNQALFTRFGLLSEKVAVDPTSKNEFDQVGLEVLDTIRFWERKLCAGMERGGHGQYSSTLAEKFWAKVRANYPLIDTVGVTHKTA